MSLTSIQNKIIGISNNGLNTAAEMRSLLDEMALEYIPFNTVKSDTGTTYNLVIGDSNNIVTLDNGSSVSVVIPADTSISYNIGTKITLINLGAGTVTVSITTDTLNQNVGGLTLAQYDKRTLTKVTAASWILGY